MRRARLITGFNGLLLGPSMHAEVPEEPDKLCAELTRLFQAVPRTGSLNVRVTTTWNEAPTIACSRKNLRAPRRFCRFVPGNMSSGGCLSSQYLSAWLITRLAGSDEARRALHYVAPVGEKDEYVERAMKNIS